MATSFSKFVRSLKTQVTIFLISFYALGMLMEGCGNDSVYDELPSKIASFVTQYFPNYGVQSYSQSSDGEYHVRLKDGPGMTFGNNYSWIVINGYGLPLPQVLMFNELPPALYMYLQETENTENVFSVERNAFTYTLTLLDETVSYDTSTKRITVDTTPKDNGSRASTRLRA